MEDSGHQPHLLSEFLLELRARGIAIGVREQFEVARLLDRWTDDLGCLRFALGSVLGTDSEEAKLVRDTFDEMYPPNCADSAEFSRLLGPLLEQFDQQGVSIEIDELYKKATSEPGVKASSDSRGKRRRRLVPGYWPGLLLVLAMTVAIGWLFTQPPATDQRVLCSDGSPPPCNPVVPPVDEAEVAPTPPPVPAEILPLTPLQPTPVWTRGAGLGISLAVLVFGLLYWKRNAREAFSAGYVDMAAQLDLLEGPQTYEIDLSMAAPPFDSGLMDDVAMLLARQASVAESRHELDVDRSLERTIEAGLAPQLVFVSRTSAEPVLVLEDISAEMRWYRRNTAALLKALRQRAVYIDHWQFDGDAGKLRHADSKVSITLERLVRQRPASPLIILSSGSGLLEPQSGAPSPWTGLLHHWLSRAWLHPVTDVSQWRPAMQSLSIPVWPMNASGLISAARHISTGEGDAGIAELRLLSPSLPVKPLQLTRLRRLVDFAPRRDPGLAELLRQQFCPSVPESAVAEAVASPPLDFPASLGPSDQEVVEFLLTVLDRSRPAPASTAGLRWRLDRAMLQMRLPDQRKQGLAELQALAEGPLAAEISAAVTHTIEQDDTRKVDDATRGMLRREVLMPIKRQARRRGRFADAWQTGRVKHWPNAVELVLPLLIAAGVIAATPKLGDWFNHRSESQPLDYSLSLDIGGDPVDGPFQLSVSGIPAPDSNLELWRDNANAGRFSIPVTDFSDDRRGHWYWVSAMTSSGVYRVSEPVWVRATASSVPLALSDRNVADEGVASVYETTGGGLILPVTNVNDKAYSNDKDNNLMTITGRYLGIQIDLAAPVNLVELGAFVDPADRESDVYKSTDEVEFLVSTDNGKRFTSAGIGVFTAKALGGFSYSSVRGNFEQVTNLRFRFRQADRGREGQRIAEVIALKGVGPSAACYWLSNKTNQWQLMKRYSTKQTCFEQDSCNGGLGRSGGGCYKWATDANATREPW